MNLLNVDANPKTVKGQKVGYITGVVYLAPATLSGTNVCPFAVLAGCKDICLNTAGRGGMAAGNKTFVAPDGSIIPDNNQQKCRIRRTELFHNDREAFLVKLEKEIHGLIRKGKRENLIPTVRLNGYSDIRWENVRFNSGDTLFERFPDIQFYDYTKLTNRRNIPANYHLTWSYSEANQEYADMRPTNMNWAVVFRNAPYPATFLNRPVVDGDTNDLRFLDQSNVVVALKAKGKARKDITGFVVNS